MDNMDDVAATIRDLRARMLQVEAEVYNIIQGMQSHYEKLLNRIKCLECHRCDINKTEDVHAKE